MKEQQQKPRPPLLTGPLTVRFLNWIRILAQIRENIFYKDIERNWSTDSRKFPLEREVKATHLVP